MKETKEMYPSWCDDHGVRLGNVKIKDLHDFKEHPFHVVEDMALFKLVKSIEDKGVLVPLIARVNPYGDGYEIIAGLMTAAEKGKIKELDADLVIMVLDHIKVYESGRLTIRFFDGTEFEYETE